MAVRGRGLHARAAAKDPLYRDDKEYPEWLFMLLVRVVLHVPGQRPYGTVRAAQEEPPTLNELLAMDPSQLTLKQIKKIQKITSKAKIKANNAALRKT